MFLQELGKDDRYQFILVQLPEPCDPKRDAYKDGYETLCDIGEGRIRRAGDKIKTELEESNRQLKLGEGPKQLPDIGFRVFELDESGIEKPEPGQLLFDVVKPDRSDMDIVFEMMLKWGLELTLPVEKSEAAGIPSGPSLATSSSAACPEASPLRRSRPSPTWSPGAFSSSIPSSTTPSSSTPCRSSSTPASAWAVRSN